MVSKNTFYYFDFSKNFGFDLYNNNTILLLYNVTVRRNLFIEIRVLGNKSCKILFFYLFGSEQNNQRSPNLHYRYKSCRNSRNVWVKFESFIGATYSTLFTYVCKKEIFFYLQVFFAK